MIEINNRRYLGSKYKLRNFIKNIIVSECGNIGSFADVFGGTGIVAKTIESKEVKVIINDILKSNYYAYLTWFDNTKIDNTKLTTIISDFNRIEVSSENYFSKNFSNTYFNNQNSKKIGDIREKIEVLHTTNKVNEREYAILITSLIYAMDKIANTVGHYDAYRRTEIDHKPLVLHVPDFTSNNSDNLVFNIDANVLVTKISADVVYIDPPYNSRQYSDAYHLLENVAEWKKPDVFGVAKKMDRTHIKSKYCKTSAPNEFRKLIRDIDAKFILVSYNDMGSKGASRSQAKLTEHDILNTLASRGKVKVFETDFNQFTTGKSSYLNHKERVYLCEIGKVDGTHIVSKTSPEYVKSPLNYTGGKYKLIKQLSSFFPKNISTFVDMFTGGNNVGVNAIAKKVISNDKNKQVIRIHNLFKKRTEIYILDKIESIINQYGLSSSIENGYKFYGSDSSSGLGKYNKNNYLILRKDYNDLVRNSERKDFLLIVLIIYGFNNQIRFNKSNKFNMPVGKRDFNNSMRKNMKAYIRRLSEIDISFHSDDFRSVLLDLDENSFVYCDPPYILGTASYNESNGWTSKDENDLLDYLKQLDIKGIKFALSNVIEHKNKLHDSLVSWCTYNRFNINYIESSYQNSNYQIKDKMNKTVEVLITNYTAPRIKQ